ncbi:cell cycle checkpoint protein rad17 [Holotrichia oblita]|uniref:Cell cycle checkpoint protein rad17 n=1 Tax=Holotrichia oblita TaxID=644536 RepID=A0ACB9SLR5_HOLOL|nr:cell cycle checkpoint protein rad17 [Holotrichia oblita]
MNLPQTLFPDELRQKFSIYNISFNATSTTLMTKAVKRAKTIIEMHTDINNITDITVDDIVSSSMGDIRCAVNQVYFTCSKVCNDLLPSTPPPKYSNKRKRKSKNETKNQILLKNERLSFFHGIGRVLNPKRVEKNGSWRLKCDIQALVDEIGIQPTTFNSFIHNNYIKYFGDIHDISNAAEILSFSQIFLNKWENRENFLNYSLWIPIMGLMVYNQHKVLKWNQITAPRKHKKV